MRPLFIVLEGIDGSGTSTQAQLLVQFLQHDVEQRVRLTSEPSGGPVGQMIRTAMSGRMRFSSDSRVFDRQMAYLFAADRHDHLYNDTNGIVKLKAEGFFVISTRYYFSSFAYHCETPDDFALVRSLNDRFPQPDLTIYMDVSVAISMKRLGQRANLDMYENATKLALARHNYEQLFSTYGGRLVKISSEQPAQSAHDEIRKAVMRTAEND